MINLFNKIKEKINENFSPENLSLIDNSHLHKKHKSFDPKKFHIKLYIKSEKLKKMNKIEAHKAVYLVLKDEMKNKIHALEIEIQ